MSNDAARSTQKVKGSWRTVFALSSAIFVDNLENYTLQILWPFMYPALGLTVGQLGPVIGVVRIIKLITTPFWGFLADRFSRKLLLVLVTGIWGLWTGVIGLIQTYNQLMIIRVASALGLAAFWPIAFSLLGDLFPREDRGKSVGVMTAVGFLGSLLSFLVLPTIAQNSADGWRMGFVVMGAASFLSGLLLLFVHEPPRGAAEKELEGLDLEGAAQEQFSFNFKSLPSLLRIRSWRAMWIQNVIDAVPMSIVFAYLFTWMMTLPFADQVIAVIPVMFLGIVAGHVAWGWAGDRLEVRRPALGRFYMGLFWLVVQGVSLLAFITLGSRSLIWLIIGGFFNGLAISGLETGARIPMMQNVLPPELRATGRGFIEMGLGLFAAVSVTVFGNLLDAGNVDFTTLLLLSVPTIKLLGILLWIPVAKAYPQDVESLHLLMEDRRDELVAAGES